MSMSFCHLAFLLVILLVILLVAFHGFACSVALLYRWVPGAQRFTSGRWGVFLGSLEVQTRRPGGSVDGAARGRRSSFSTQSRFLKSFDTVFREYDDVKRLQVGGVD